MEWYKARSPGKVGERMKSSRFCGRSLGRRENCGLRHNIICISFIDLQSTFDLSSLGFFVAVSPDKPVLLK